MSNSKNPVELEDVEPLMLDRRLEGKLKTEQEMCKHSIDIDLETRPVERAEYILTVGEEVQRLSVLESLPDLLRDDNKLCMQRVVPKVRQALPNASAEFHMAASSTFLTILEKNLVHPKTFTQTFLHSIVSSLESKDPVVATAWLETLLDVMDLLPTEVVCSEILPIAISKGQLNQSVSSRLTACKLLGKVCMRFESYILKKEALPLVHSLCQDVNREVRASMCYQLKHVAKGLGPEVCKIALLPSLVELANDEEASVRLAAVPTIVDVLPLLQPDTLKGTIVPLVKKLCSQALNAEDEVITATSYQLGKLCLGLDSHLTKTEKKWFMNHYQDLAKLGLASMKDSPSVPQRQDIEIPFWDYKQVCSSSHPLVDCPLFVTHTRDELYIICRQHCAYNFPAMAMFSTKHGDIFHEQLYTTFCDLTSDPYVMVRRTIACCIHEVTSVLGSASSMVKNEVVKLLRDEDDEVLQGLIPNIAATLELLAKSGNIKPENMDTTAVEMGRALMKCEAKIGSTHNWRLHSLLISQLECLPSCLPGDFIHSQFVPMMFARIHTARPIPCRTAAAHALLIFLRFTRKPSQKAEILARISTELGHAKSCYSRMMFIKLCRLAMEVFSTIYFKEYFFLNMLDLYVDGVPNIRLALVKEMPRLKMMLCLPMDHKLFMALETCIRKLLVLEKDRDVLGLLNCVIQELDKIEVPMEGSTIVREPTEEELEDKRKLEEENKLALSKFETVQRKSMRRKTIPPSTGLVSVVKAPPTLPGGVKRVAAGSINLGQTQKLQTEPRQSTSKTRDTKGAFSSSMKRTLIRKPP